MPVSVNGRASTKLTISGVTLDAAEVQEFARRSLRGSKTPEIVSFVEALPFTETGKLLRRVVQADLLPS